MNEKKKLSDFEISLGASALKAKNIGSRQIDTGLPYTKLRVAYLS